MKKVVFLIIVSFFLLSCVTTTNSTKSEKPIFSTDEYSVKSFEKNPNGYLLTFLSIEDSVPDGAMILISVGNSGEGQPYKNGTLQYQFGSLGIPETSPFDIEFGIGVPIDNQIKTRSTVTFKNITVNDIAEGLEQSDNQLSQEMESIDYSGLRKRAELYTRINDEIILDSTGSLDYYSNSDNKNFVRLTMENINNPNNNTSTEYSFMANGTLENATKESSHLRNQAFFFPVSESRVIEKQIDGNNVMIIDGMEFDLELISEVYDISQDHIDFYYSQWKNSLRYDAIIVNSHQEGILGIVGVGNFVDKWDGGGNPDMDSFTYVFYSPED